MDRMLYLSMTGAKHAMLTQQKVSHNLANVDTPGFKSDFAQFISQPVQGPGFESRTYAQAAGFGVDMKQGGTMSTGRELDVAPAGETWMAVLAPDGSETYTRRGDLHIADSGLMVNGTGDVVLGINGPITIPPSAGLEVGVDGAVTVQPLGQNSNTRLLIDRIKLVTPEQGELVKDINGKFRTADNVPLDPNASAKLLTGVLEGSNVNVVEGMVSMIENSRNYELQIKMMKNAEDKERTGGRLLRNPS